MNTRPCRCHVGDAAATVPVWAFVTIFVAGLVAIAITAVAEFRIGAQYGRAACHDTHAEGGR